ncbi:secreted protein [Candidatus Magnetomorum sp. HK-1]|nr:secreted protein [Candidatus Magnetomorum sp. HK-1]
MKKSLIVTILLFIFNIGMNLNLFAYDYYDCIFSPDSTDWQFSHQNAYRLTTGRTSNNTPTGHIQVQTEGILSINQGSLMVYINGRSVLLYSDPNLENNIGKNYSYQAGAASKDFWFYDGTGAILITYNYA